MRIRRVLISLFLLPLAPAAHGLPLGSGAVSRTYVTIGVIDSLEINVSFGGIAVGRGPTLFEGLQVGLPDVGSTFTATSASDPDFDAAATVLTNGVNDEVFFRVSPGSAPHPTEALFFFGDATGANGIDFAGSIIDSVDLRIDLLTFDNDGISTLVRLDYSILVNGVVIPEPRPTVLIFLGLLALGWRRRRALPARRYPSLASREANSSLTRDPMAGGLAPATSMFQRAVKQAARGAGIPKRVSCHRILMPSSTS
jgi:hypothetical protein